MYDRWFYVGKIIEIFRLNKSFNIETWILAGLLKNGNNIGQYYIVYYAQVGPQNMGVDKLERAVLLQIMLLGDVCHMFNLYELFLCFQCRMNDCPFTEE